MTIDLKDQLTSSQLVDDNRKMIKIVLNVQDRINIIGI